jgi:hypothetical protein
MADKKVVIIENTEANNRIMIEMALAQYVGENCIYCRHEYTSNEDIRARKVVMAGEYKLACKACFDTNNGSVDCR